MRTLTPPPQYLSWDIFLKILFHDPFFLQKYFFIHRAAYKDSLYIGLHTEDVQPGISIGTVCPMRQHHFYKSEVNTVRVNAGAASNERSPKISNSLSSGSGPAVAVVSKEDSQVIGSPSTISRSANENNPATFAAGGQPKQKTYAYSILWSSTVELKNLEKKLSNS
jgi:hypothetical protein